MTEKNILNNDLVQKLLDISIKAGQAILDIYNDLEIEVIEKKDSSPLTKADLASHNIIVSELSNLTPDIPILSEESIGIPFNTRKEWSQYWLVDPLDGTKEFIKRNGEFTVNIALIRNNTPIFGVIYVPVSDEIYWGSKEGSYYKKTDGTIIKIQISNESSETMKIVASKSHQSEMLSSILANIKEYELINKGSSLKFCMVAEGSADIYLRLGLTSEWDTAAGEAIVHYAGGHVIATSGELIKYNAEKSILNPNFIVSGKKGLTDLFLSLIQKNES
ncbi:3'(2'),5'-bisphosphate nucleotidase CysQ [Gammaproteobacteria bacterium]|nr:3'(2'),5'-bisphosphate nucleotidase CysQ [Gammaproteobacteria bacterium]